MHKARRAKLDREQKECEGEGEEVDEGENEHAVMEWGNKETCESGKEGEREKRGVEREREKHRQGCEQYEKKSEYTGLRIKANGNEKNEEECE